MGAAIHHHIGKELCLVNLTGLGARNSDPDGYLVLHQVRQIVVGAIAGPGLCIHVPARIRPHHSVINKENINRMSLGVGDLGELKTPGRTIDLVFT